MSNVHRLELAFGSRRLSARGNAQNHQRCGASALRRLLDQDLSGSADSLQAKKQLIEALTRRLFNHTEHGLNIPGCRLGEARRSYQAETDPGRRRVKAAMLAGALFNRATDIFRKLVELQADGIEIHSDDALMRECGQCLLDAMDLGHVVLHRSGEEGIDELWGEPFRAFSVPIEEFYENRYIKIGQSMRDIDRIAEVMIATFSRIPAFTPPSKHRCGILPTPPESRRRPCAPTGTFSMSGRNWSPPASGWPTSRRDMSPNRSESEPAGCCTGFPMASSCSATAATWCSTSPAPARRCPRAPANTLERCEAYLATGRVPCMPAPLPA
jgi:hypothetical protein